MGGCEMKNKDYIIKDPQWQATQDYQRLRKEGLQHIEQLGASTLDGLQHSRSRHNSTGIIVLRHYRSGASN